MLRGEEGGLIQMAEGKSKAARRILPMVPDVLNAMRARHGAQGCPAKGWVFPSKSKGYQPNYQPEEPESIARSGVLSKMSGKMVRRAGIEPAQSLRTEGF